MADNGIPENLAVPGSGSKPPSMLKKNFQSLYQKASNLFKSKDVVANDTLWKLAKDLWEKGESKKDYVEKMRSYYEGELVNKLPGNSYFSDQEKSCDNVIEPIVETKISTLLDAQFVTSVVPDMGSFFDPAALKECQNVADILNDGVIAVQKDNKCDQIDEEVARDGELCGFGGSQVEWDTKERPDGVIKIKAIEARKIRWNKHAKRGKITMLAYEDEMSPAQAKETFAIDEDGKFDEDLCKKIDEISETDTGEKSTTHGNAVVNYVNASNNTAGRAFTSESGGGIQAGKKVEFIVMFLMDTSVYAPEEKDETDVEQAKEEYIKAFPYGRKIVFSLNPKSKLILEDSASEETFKGLGNIDIYNSISYKGLVGRSPIDSIIPIQDRINGLYAKYREKIANDFDTLLVDESFGDEENAIVRAAITKVKDYNTMAKAYEVMSNQGIEKGKSILEAIEMLKKTAYEKAHVNETMMYGTRQAGTSSAEQVDALQESPMVPIRRQQRNFKEYKIAQAEKILLFICANYTNQRLIQLSTGIDGATMARIDTNTDTQQRNIELLKEAEGTVKVIKSIPFNDKWKFKVEVTAGTEIPRSRRELAELTDKLATNPIMTSGNIPMIEAYLNAQDYPMKRAFISILKQQQKEQQANPHKMTVEDLVKNPAMGTAAANLFKSLTGFSKAQGQMLTSLGLDGTTDTITTAPAQQVSAKSQVEDIAAIAPAQISENPQQAVFGNQAALQLKEAAAINKAGRIEQKLPLM